MPQSRLAIVAVALLVVLTGAGCSGEDNRPEARPSQSHAPSGPDPAPDSPCADEESRAVEEGTAELSSLQGDVDGDGRADSVSLVTSEEAQPGCRAILVVRSGGAPLTVPVEGEGAEASVVPPSVSGLANIDGRDGSEVIVRLISGASTEFYVAFSAAGGRLEGLTVQGGEFGDLFPSGGSVGHLQQTDCRDAGSIVVATAVPQGDRYLLRRAVFDFDGKTFSRNAAASTKELVAADDLASGAVPEFASGAPFSSCPTD